MAITEVINIVLRPKNIFKKYNIIICTRSLYEKNDETRFLHTRTHTFIFSVSNTNVEHKPN